VLCYLSHAIVFIARQCFAGVSVPRRALGALLPGGEQMNDYGIVNYGFQCPEGHWFLFYRAR
jgi:hypothetical protein